MNISLDDYIKRSREILNEKTNKISLLDNEYCHMISFLESTLAEVKLNYEKFKNIEKKESSVTEHTAENTLEINNSKLLNLTDFIDKKDDSSAKMHWIPEINQYYLKINDLVLRGNIGNIYDKKILQNDKINAHQVAICMHGKFCQDILNERYCKFYHDPMDLYDLKIMNKISEEYYKNHIRTYTRNFSNTSWLYNSNNRTFLVDNIRNIGSKSALVNDISILKQLTNKYRSYIIDNMKHQVMHDILVLLVLSENNLA